MRTTANALTIFFAATVWLSGQGGGDTQLVERARREGTLTLYTSLAPTESQPLANAFEKKYGVKVQLWRALSDEVVQRVVTEAKGRRHSVDVVETNGPEMEMIAREKLLDGAWSPDRVNLFVVGYNTTKVKRADIPATYEGFTDPKWKGRIALEATDSEWMATLIKTMPNGKGMELMRKLSALQPALRKGHVLLASLVAAGDVPVGLAMYDSNIQTLKQKGAPIDLVPVQPVVARPQGVGVANSAPHPNAARLFREYVLSTEGQQLFASMGRNPARADMKNVADRFPVTFIDPATVLDEASRWEKTWSELFVRR